MKWVILVLIAGIGQFGRMTAEAIVARVRAGRNQKGEKYKRRTGGGFSEDHPRC